jgi:D-alanyl-D-alanine carboxypeptidase
VRRGDKRVVGVVLGGRTGASRDAYMKAMLTKYFPKARGGKAIAAYAGSSKGAVAVNEASPPESAEETAQTKQAARQESASKRLNKRKTQASQNEVAAAPAEQGDTEDSSLADLAAQAAAQPPATTPSEQVEVVPQPSPDIATATTGDVPFQVKTPEQQLADKAQVASISPPADAGWIINLGDYATKNDAQAVLQLLRKRAPDAVDGRTAQTVMIEKNGQVTYRARFTGFDEAAAAAACKTIRRQNTPCRAQGPS